MNVIQREKCSECNGAGSKHNHRIGGWDTCKTCGGTGFNIKKMEVKRNEIRRSTK